MSDWYPYVFSKNLIKALFGKELSGYHTANERALVRKYAFGRRRLVEIGIYNGVSSLAIRESMSPQGVLWLIDPFIPDSMIKTIKGNYLIAKLYVSRSKNGEVVWLREFSYNIAPGWSQNIDFLFIDGEHNEAACMKDWLDWSPFIEKGGVVLFHDARADQKRNEMDNTWYGWPGPTQVVNRLFRGDKRDSSWMIVEEKDSIVVVEKI